MMLIWYLTISKLIAMNKIICSFLLMILIISCDRSAKTSTDELYEIEKAFSAMSQEKGMVAAFNFYCHEDGVLLRPNSLPTVGKKSVSEILENTPDSLFLLTWIPSEARISESGDLGYTYGIYTLTSNDTLTPTVKGTYVTIWAKDEQEQWKFVMDTGQEGLE